MTLSPRRLVLRSLAAAAALAGLSAFPAAALADGGCTITTSRPKLYDPGQIVRTATVDQFQFTSSDVPKSLGDGVTTPSTITVNQGGKLRSIKVKVGGLTHPDLTQLKLELRAPDGTKILLADARPGTSYTNTTFAEAGPSILSASAPYTGTFAPQGLFSDLLNKDIGGVWRLEISDAAGGAAGGTLTAWSLDITRQPCSTASIKAAFTATPAQAVPGQQVAFDASTSRGTNGGVIASYQWDWDGDGVYDTLPATSPLATHAFATKGTYAVGLKVTDAGGSDETTVSVPVTVAPTATFTMDNPTPLSQVPVHFDASGSNDSDGQIVRYQWDLDGDGSYERDAGTSPLLDAAFAQSGLRTVRLKVTDDNCATNVFAVDVMVSNRRPVAAFAVQNPPAIVGAITTLDGSLSSDSDGLVKKWEWDLDNNGSYELDGGTAKTTGYTINASGTYTVGLRVTDNSNDTDTTTITFVATKAPVAVMGASAAEVRPGVPVTFDPAGSADQDPTGSIVSYRYDFGDGSPPVVTSSAAPVSHTYTSFGDFTVTLTVTDDQGAQSAKTVLVRVVNKSPLAALAIGPNPAKAGETVTFSAAGSADPDGRVVRYEWDLDGNGTYETDTSGVDKATRSYPNRVRASVKLRVTDNDGASAVMSAPLAVDGAVAPGGTTKPKGTAAGGSKSAVFSASLLGAPVQKLKAALKRGVGVVCQVDRKATCAIEVVVMPRDAKRLKLAKGKKAKKPVRIAAAKRSTAGSGKAALKLKLSKKAKKALKRSKTVVLVVRGSATDASGTRVTLRRAVMLRR